MKYSFRPTRASVILDRGYVLAQNVNFNETPCFRSPGTIAQINKLKGNIERYTLRFSKKLHYLCNILFKP